MFLMLVITEFTTLDLMKAFLTSYETAQPGTPEHTQSYLSAHSRAGLCDC